MKKIITCVLISFSLSSLEAQVEKCDINIRKHIFSDVHGSTQMIPVLARGDVFQMRSLTEALGGRFKYFAGDIVSIELPQNKLSDFASRDYVIRMESSTPRMIPLNDTMRVNNNINEIHAGLAPLPQSYDGTGVVTGFVDTGIDFNHPDFKDSAGNSRIAWLWDHKLPVAANTPMPYNYGQEFSNTDIDAGLASAHNDLLHLGHGTNSAGIASGNGLATGFNQGCAPKSDIIMVAYDFGTQQPNRIADGINYIFDKANVMGKPCVVNLSLGDIYGSHDGRDLEAQLINNMLHAQNGRLIVSANGNWGGDDKRHLSYTVNSDTSWTWFKYDPAIHELYLELWGDSADMVNAKFSIGGDANNTSASFLGRTPFRMLSSISVAGTLDLISAIPGDSVIWYKDKVNGVVELQIEIRTLNPSYYWRLMTTGTGKFDMRYVYYSGNLPSAIEYASLPSASVVPEIVYYKPPDSLVSLSSSFNCLDDVVSVGYYYNRNTNYDCFGNLQYKTLPSGDTVQTGTLVTTSSLGPTRDGRQKPEITASGNLVMAPIPVSLAMGSLHNSPYLNLGCYHYYAGGSSSASPIVAGIGALYLQKNPNTTPSQFKQDIICGAKTDSLTGTNLPDYSWGYGKTNGFKTLNSCFVGIDELQNGSVFASVQPNPFSQFTTIHLLNLKKDFKTISLYVYDMLGKKIETVPQQNFFFGDNKASVYIDRKQINAGIYFFTVVTDKKMISKGKLVIE